MNFDTASKKPSKGGYQDADAVPAAPQSQYQAFGAQPIEIPSNIPVAENVVYADASQPPAEGVPLYAPEDVQAAPELKRFTLGGFRDIWAGVLFLAVFLMTIIWGIVNLCTYKIIHDKNAPLDGAVNAIGVGGFFAAMAASAVLSVIGVVITMVLMAKFPAKVILIANIVSIVFTAASMVMAFVLGQVWLGVLLIVAVLFNCLWLFLVRSRIAFSGELLRAAMAALAQHKLIFAVNVVIALVFFGYMITWWGAVLPPLDKTAADRGKGVDGFLIALFVLIFFWTSQVVPNLMHVTTSGVVATWYFCGSKPLPRNATVQSLRRALTTSFGSICFGSLIVALIKFLRWLVEMSRNNEDGNQFVQCCLSCILRCVEGLVEYFNTYAFVHVAIYGCGYIEAAKRTFGLVSQCFFAAYFNDCLVGNTLDILSFTFSILVGCIIGLIAHTWLIGILAFFIALVIHHLFYMPVSSAITTIFVCFAEVPEALRQTDPDLYATIHASDRGETNNNAPPPV